MATTEHKKATELHQNAANSHLAAADSLAKGDAAKGTEHAKVAQQHSQSARQANRPGHLEEPTAEVATRGPVRAGHLFLLRTANRLVAEQGEM